MRAYWIRTEILPSQRLPTDSSKRSDKGSKRADSVALSTIGIGCNVPILTGHGCFLETSHTVKRTPTGERVLLPVWRRHVMTHFVLHSHPCLRLPMICNVRRLRNILTVETHSYVFLATITTILCRSTNIICEHFFW